MKDKEIHIKIGRKKMKEVMESVNDLLKEVEGMNGKAFSIAVEINAIEDKPKEKRRKKK